MAEFYDAYREVLAELGFTDHLNVLDEHVSHRATVDSVKALLENTGFQSKRSHIRLGRNGSGIALLLTRTVRGLIPPARRVDCAAATRITCASFPGSDQPVELLFELGQDFVVGKCSQLDAAALEVYEV